ncbi:MFS transporter [Cellulomonas denverensis]|uniref:MFS transporter n=1 Tax=Cellulomonas denverensis TaxID=264297 RepID=UPI0035E6F627
MSIPATGMARHPAVLACALLTLELVAGIQSYLLSTIVPVVAAELDARHLYGVITASAQVAMFVTMPWGPALLARFRADRVLLVLTGATVAGAALAAVAPTVAVFVAGRAVTGLATGAMATVSLSAIVTVLPSTWRRVVLAGYNAVWVAASLVGPVYAGAVAHAVGWRWAMVLYLPLLLAARWVAAGQLRRRLGEQDQRLPVLGALAVAAGVALVGLLGDGRWWALPLGVAGAVLALAAVRGLLPAGSLRAARGRPAAVATLGLITAAHLGIWSVVAILVQDRLGGTAGQAAVALACGGMAWAVAGLAVARWLATAAHYPRRMTGALALMLLGLAGLAAAVLDPGGRGVPVAMVAWTLMGLGMGSSYLDTLNRVVDPPVEQDGVEPTVAAGAAVLVESAGGALLGTAAAAAFSLALRADHPAPVMIAVFAAAGGLVLLAGVTSRRTAVAG